MSKAIDYCKNVFDGTHDTPKPASTGYKLLTSKNILNGRLDKDDAYFISPEDYESVNQRSRVKQWDVLFSMIGTVGNVCLVRDSNIDFAIKNMGDFSCEHEGKAKWLYYWLQSPCAKQLMQNYLSGAVQKFLPLGWLRDLEIPDYNQEKESISSLLWLIDSKIDNNNEICSDLEAMAKLLYDYWFVQFDFPDENGKPYKSSGGRMIWNEELKREIPEGWEVTSLKPFIRVIRGVSYTPEQVSSTPKAGYVPLLKSNNLQNDELVLDDIIYVPVENVSQEQYLLDDSIFVTMSSGSTEHVGKTALITYNTPFCYGAFCSKIVIDPNYRCFVSMFFLSEFFKKRIRSIIVGTSIKNINNEHLTENVVALPPKPILKRFEHFCNPLFDMQGSIIQENLKLKSLRDFLLPMLMNGQVKVQEKAI